MTGAVSLLGLVVVILASLGWSALDAFRKILSSRMGPMTVLVWLMGTQAMVFTGVTVGADGFWMESGYFLPGSAALLLNMLANWLFIVALSISPLSRTIPFLSLTPAFTLLVGIPLLGEIPSYQQIAGIVVIVAGALLLNARDTRLIRALLEERGSVMMVAVAFIWSLVAPLDKLSLQYASISSHSLYQTFGIASGFALFLVIRGRGRELKDGVESIHIVCGAALLASVTLALQLESYQLMMVSLAEAIKRAMGIILAIVIGRFYFKESVTPQKIGAMVLMCIGACLLVFK